MVMIYSLWDVLKIIPIALAYIIAFYAGLDFGNKLYDYLWGKKNKKNYGREKTIGHIQTITPR
jgi:hypothetical protein